MSRTRLINPAAPKDEAVASCSVWARLAWAYLPCHADKEGRLADKPLTLRFELFPADPQVDMDALLGELARTELIVRYQVAGRRYIQIRSFARHQHPHKNEADSVIPPCPEPSGNYASAPAQLSVCPERSGDPDPDPVTDPVTDPVGDPVRADPAPEPRAHAIPVDDGWPGQEPGQVTYHHGVLRARGKPPPGKLQLAPTDRYLVSQRAQRLLDLFAKVRSEVARTRGQTVVAWTTPGARAFNKAVAFVHGVEDDHDAQLDVEPTMRMHLQEKVDSPDKRDFEVGFAFGAWLHRFSDLREDIHGMKRTPLAGLSDRERKNLVTSQLWLARKEAEQEAQARGATR